MELDPRVRRDAVTLLSGLKKVQPLHGSPPSPANGHPVETCTAALSTEAGKAPGRRLTSCRLSDILMKIPAMQP